MSSPINNNTAATEERSQPWQTMQEVQQLFKQEETPALRANAEADNAEEEPLKLNLFRTALNCATTNIVNVEEKKAEEKH